MSCVKGTSERSLKTCANGTYLTCFIQDASEKKYAFFSNEAKQTPKLCFKNILIEQVYWYKQTKQNIRFLWPDLSPANILCQDPQKKQIQEQIWPQGMLYNVELNRFPSQVR